MFPEDLPSDRQHELNVALQAGRQAAEVILGFYNDQSAATYTKGDGSPVTDADLASDKVIRQVLTEAFPDDALMTEEGAAELSRLENARCWIVDPIDGTAQFVGRTGAFDVMIALAINGEVEVAVAVQPVTGLIQAAVRGYGAWEMWGDQITAFRVTPASQPPHLVASKYYQGHELYDLLRKVAEALGTTPPPVMDVGFQSRNFSPENRNFDAFIGLPQPNHGSIAQEWDLATVDLIVTEAGGCLTDCFGRRHRYNKRSTGISGGLLVSSDPDLHAKLVQILSKELGDPPSLDPADDPLVNA